jgi:hypothetical protein
MPSKITNHKLVLGIWNLHLPAVLYYLFSGSFILHAGGFWGDNLNIKMYLTCSFASAKSPSALLPQTLEP